jgi:hypothetical protein
MRVRPYTEADAGEWDALVRESACGTFLHTRRFLSYHGKRFTDCSMICEDSKGDIAAVMPAALKPDNPASVASHPGATYGGLLCRANVGVDEIGEMLGGMIEHYRAMGLRSLEYRSVPPHFHEAFQQTDVHALWKQGAELARRDVWNVLSLRGAHPAYSNHHQRAIARAAKRAMVVSIDESEAGYRAFHEILVARLEDRYGVSPVHTLEEMLVLKDRFPLDIALWLARDAGQSRVLAGCWVFMHSGRAWHTQYIAATQEGRDCCATHLLFDRVIQQALEKAARFVSFGCSTEDEGRRLNRGLFEFKAGFGAGTVCHDTYRLRLTT